MTSELEKLIAEQYGDRCPEYDADCPCCQIWSEYDTRAVSDVPELVRHDVQLDGQYFDRMATSKDGLYVLHSQAAEIIAAKDAEIAVGDVAIKQNALLWKRAEAAEAKLASAIDLVSRAQELVPYGCESWHNFAREALGASPAPAADLKAKCGRYEQALVDIAAFKEKGGTDAATTQWNRAGLYAATIARAALNVEASDDKG